MKSFHFSYSNSQNIIINFKFNNIFCLLILPIIFCSCRTPKNNSCNNIRINVWYGTEQTFGKLGNPQRQINIQGNIHSEEKDIKVFYTLNDSKTRNYLTLGCDLHRLAGEGDFNIDIDRGCLNHGKNKVYINVNYEKNNLCNEVIVLHYFKNKKWPLPYYVRWDEVNNIQDVVEVVDGEWEISDSGVRTKQMYYDRILAFGDSTWRNYEVETTVTFHDYTTPSPGPPTYNVSHVAIASRWPGHDIDSLQPNRKWHPLGATSEFRITDQYDSCRWRIFDGENFYREQSISEYRRIRSEMVYKIKHRVEDISETETRYSVRIWPAGEDEPAEWDLQALEASLKKESGGACLIAHHTDVTFGNIIVTTIPAVKDE